MDPDVTQEIILIGLPGPTHHYGGLSADNVASSLNRGSISSPKQAALQAISLVRVLKKLGVQAGVLPPHLRPYLPLLRETVAGDDETVIQNAPIELLEKASSSSAMWVANAATISPLIDSDALHITPANLYTNLHRRIEAETTHHHLREIFAHVPNANVHAPLASGQALRDEGAANHMRLAPSHNAKGLHVFVYGAQGDASDPASARQSLAASQAIAAQHHLPAEQCIFVRQNPEIIRLGVFHNDVIAVSNGHVLLVHEAAYVGGRADIARIEAAYVALHPNQKLCTIMISDAELSVEEAISTYFFNSQIITKPDGTMAIIAPSELDELYDRKASKLLQKICSDKNNPINEMHMLDLRQSMRNGGGPACLRLRVPLNNAQILAMQQHTNILASDDMLGALEQLIEKYYPDTLSPEGLRNPSLYKACSALLGELSALLKINLI